MRIFALLIPALAAVLTPSVHARGQDVLSDPETAISKHFWPEVYAEGGTTLYCTTPFSGADNLKAAHLYSVKQIKNALECMTDSQCTVKTPAYMYMVSDLHNLYPAEADIETKRRQAAFGSLANSARMPNDLGCNTQATFHLIEPSAEAKGNIARAYFYMHHAYRLPLGAELALLKKWHEDDPVDAAELARNDKIAAIQGTRNPFIDDPKLADTLTGN